MGAPYKLPVDQKQTEEVIANLISQGKSKRNPQAVKWYVNYFYMLGLREFSNLNYGQGTVSVSYLNEEGILKFRYDEIVAKYQAQLGRLMALDLSPSVHRRGISLNGIRNSSVAQVVLDAAFPQDKVRKLSLELCSPLLLYGTVGIGLWVEDSDSIGIEVILPWEILPIPVDVAGPSDVRGVIRCRYVPVDWVNNLSILSVAGRKGFQDLERIDIPSGSLPTDIDALGDGLISMATGSGAYFIKSSTFGQPGTKEAKKKNETQVPITMLVEVWTETADGFLGEYSIFAGVTKFKQLYRRDHTQNKYPMPVRIIRDVTVGGFWGRSFVDQLIPLNHELEIALSSVFEAVSDFDIYGVQLWPTTLGTPPLAERGQDGIKRIRYESDPLSPDVKPENIMPAKMAAPQIEAVRLASTLMDKISNQPAELMAGGAPGRVDSSAGLGLLYEISGIPLSPTARNLADGVSGVYRAILRLLKDIWPDQKVIEISNLDDSLAGIILDAEAGTTSLSKNAIPYPDEVSITIASEIPISREQAKMELKEALDKRIITLEEYSFEVRKRGLDLPVGLEINWQNYRRAMLENILLFGDGEIPGRVIVSENDMHRVHLDVLMAFTARPEFYAASQAVRDAFFSHIEEHKIGLGTYPEQLPTPDVIAEQTLGGQIPPQIGTVE